MCSEKTCEPTMDEIFEHCKVRHNEEVCTLKESILFCCGAGIAQSVQRLRYGLEGKGSIPNRGKIFFSTPKNPDRLWGPNSLLSNGYRGALFTGVKRSEREADHSPPPGA
jgi:hypothetical protein